MTKDYHVLKKLSISFWDSSEASSMRLFRRKKENESNTPKNELIDIPVGSMIELSDMATFNLEEKTTQTFELKAYKKYEADGFLRYVYDLMDGEEIFLGVDFNTATDECNIVRFVMDSEEEFVDALDDTIEMNFEDPEEEGKTFTIEYNRFNVVNTKMTLVSPDGSEEHDDIELQDFEEDEGSILMVELWRIGLHSMLANHLRPGTSTFSE